MIKLIFIMMQIMTFAVRLGLSNHFRLTDDAFPRFQGKPDGCASDLTVGEDGMALAGWERALRLGVVLPLQCALSSSS